MGWNRETIVIGEKPLDSESVDDPGLRAHRRYDALDGQLLLVRPDGYLAARAPLSRPDIPERYLGRLTPTSPRAVHSAAPISLLRETNY